MEKENITVRQLAKKSNDSASVIQDLRSGARDNPTIDEWSKILHSLNETTEIKKNGRKLATV
jgi:predicted transcriptional regulator